MDDAQFDKLLAGHLRRRLDPQVGRVADGVIGCCGTGSLPVASPVDVGSGAGNTLQGRPRCDGLAAAQRPRRVWPRLALAGGLAAAVVALAAILWPRSHDLPRAEVVTVPPTPATPTSASPTRFGRTVAWSTQDEGTLMLDDTPVRQIRTRILEASQWFDADHEAYITVTQPRQRLVLVGVPVQ